MNIANSYLVINKFYTVPIKKLKYLNRQLWNQFLLCTILLFIISFSNNQASSQEKKYSFSILGSVKGIDSGQVQFIRVGGEDFSNIELKSKIVNVSKGVFTLTGIINYPQAFYALLINGKQNVHTDIFFVAPGAQKFYCDIDSIYDRTPTINNSVNNEFVSKYLIRNKNIDEQYQLYRKDVQAAYKKSNGKLSEYENEKFKKVIREISISTDSIVLNYIKDNPKSYVGLWQLVDKFSAKGYSTVFEKAYSLLSTTLKNTTTGKYLLYGLNESKVTGKGSIFPSISLLTENDATINLVIGKNKFTLLDFWYSRCTPCIAEFPAIIDLYNTFKVKNFEIIGISVDTKKDKNNWKEAIEKYGLVWQHLWDMNGISSKKIFINSYPTNFLLDDHGIIIQKNIKPEQLKRFLEKNL